MPDLRTNKIPVSASRLPIGGRPPLGDRSIGGSNGSIASHKSSEINTFAIGHPPCDMRKKMNDGLLTLSALFLKHQFC
jgi:hypothetical protein